MLFVRRMPKGMNKGAYRGKLTCPVCHSEAIRWIEDIGLYRRRYRCRKCGLPFQYDISGHPDPQSFGAHPYAPFKKRRFQDIVEMHNRFGRTKKRSK
jgi:hypothetical protein